MTPARGATRGSMRGPNDRPHPRPRAPPTRSPRTARSIRVGHHRGRRLGGQRELHPARAPIRPASWAARPPARPPAPQHPGRLRPRGLVVLRSPRQRGRIRPPWADRPGIRTWRHPPGQPGGQARRRDAGPGPPGAAGRAGSSSAGRGHRRTGSGGSGTQGWTRGQGRGWAGPRAGPRGQGGGRARRPRVDRVSRSEAVRARSQVGQPARRRQLIREPRASLTFNLRLRVVRVGRRSHRSRGSMIRVAQRRPWRIRRISRPRHRP